MIVDINKKVHSDFEKMVFMYNMRRRIELTDKLLLNTITPEEFAFLDKINKKYEGYDVVAHMISIIDEQDDKLIRAHNNLENEKREYKIMMWELTGVLALIIFFAGYFFYKKAGLQ